MIDGVCDDCVVLGCDVCGENAFVCEQCVDTNTFIINDLCICTKVWQKPDSTGICIECAVLGCASCDSDDNSKCSSAIDPTATINENGVVICPDGGKIDSYGMCTTCQVIGCEECAENNPN